jgi:hypothetical protein
MEASYDPQQVALVIDEGDYTNLLLALDGSRFLIDRRAATAIRSLIRQRDTIRADLSAVLGGNTYGDGDRIRAEPPSSILHHALVRNHYDE